MVIFDEKTYVEKTCFKNGFVIRTTEDLFRIIRYYTYLGNSPADIKDILLDRECSKTIRTSLEDNYYFAMACTKANAHQLRTNQPIGVTEYECGLLETLDDVELRKVLLTMFVVQKIMQSNVFRITNDEIKKLSMTQIEKSKIPEAIHKLEKAGMIEVLGKKKYKLNRDYSKVVRSNIEFEVTDFNRIPAKYLKRLRTSEYYYCENCGRKVVFGKDATPNDMRRVYCSKCSKTRKHTKKS